MTGCRGWFYFLSEPAFDSAVALLSVCRGQSFDRGALFRMVQRSPGVGQPEFERVLGRGRLCERGGELGVALREALGGGSGE